MTLTSTLTLRQTIIHIYFPKSKLHGKVIYAHDLPIIKFHQVLTENYFQYDINAKIYLESQKQNQK